MKIKAVRLHGAGDVRLDTYELPEIKEDEILTKVISDSLCMSTFKAASLGSRHRRVPDDIAEFPTIMGHEFAGEIVQVGSKWKGLIEPGDKFTIQPALNYKGSPNSPGYSYRHCGGNATYTILPNEVMELGCLLKYDGEGFYNASLAEPMSCIIGAYNAHYHTTFGNYQHHMGLKQGGNMAILAGAGPMGMGAIDYALHHPTKPALLVVVDTSTERLDRAAQILTVAEAHKNGVVLHYINGSNGDTIQEELMALTGGTGYDDVFVYAPVTPLLELGDRLLAHDGCLNFFAGPTDEAFSAKFNFYNVHYKQTHLVGTSGGNTDDMRESLELTAKGIINPAVMVTHVGGLDCVPETLMNLPNIPGGKKLIYNGIRMPLTAITDFEKLGETNPAYLELSRIIQAHNGLWNTEAEKYLLATMPAIEEDSCGH